MLKAFGALPTEERARAMTHRDYLWCAVNMALDGEEELARLCPACRAEAEEDRCPVCGENRGFDMERFLSLGGDGE